METESVVLPELEKLAAKAIGFGFGLVRRIFATCEGEDLTITLFSLARHSTCECKVMVEWQRWCDWIDP